MPSHRGSMRSGVRELDALLDDANRAEQLLNEGESCVTADRAKLHAKYDTLIREFRSLRHDNRGQKAEAKELITILADQRKVLPTVKPNHGMLEHFQRELRTACVMKTDIWPHTLERREEIANQPILPSYSHENLLPKTHQLIDELQHAIAQLARSEDMVHDLDETKRRVTESCKELQKASHQVSFDEPDDGATSDWRKLYRLASPLHALVIEIQTALIQRGEWNPVRLGIFIDKLRALLLQYS